MNRKGNNKVLIDTADEKSADTKESENNRREYEPELFVNRDAELQLVQKKIKQKDREPITEPIVNFWGVYGIGKTWLLHFLADRYRYGSDWPSQETSLSKKTFTWFYAFSDAAESTYLPNIAQSLANELLIQLADVLSEEQKAQLSQVRDSINIEKVVKVIVELSSSFTPVLLFDGAELVPPSVWEGLELQLIEPLAMTDRIVLVFAGRRQVPRWFRFEVRRRVMEPDHTQLPAFEMAQIADQLEKLHYKLPVELLLNYTAGNPILVDKVAKYVHEAAGGEQPDQAWFDAHRETLAQILLRYENELLKNFPDDLRLFLDALAPLRSYRLEALRFMLTARDNTYENEPPGFYLRLLRRLDSETEVVWWSRANRAYVTDQVVRQVINQRLLLANEGEYINQHQRAIALYAEWARQWSDASEDFILEIWFHQAHLWRATRDEQKLRDTIDKWVEFAGRELELERFIILQNQFVGEDKNKGDKELRRLLPREVLKELEQTLERLSKEKEAEETAGKLQGQPVLA